MPVLVCGSAVALLATVAAVLFIQAMLFFGLAAPAASSAPLAAGAGLAPQAGAGSSDAPSVVATSAAGASSQLAQPTGPVGADELETVEGIRVHRSIAADVEALLAHARRDGVELSGWGWRDGDVQIRLRREHCGTSQYAIYEMPSSQCSPPTARPGRSQHERGLAIDFTYFGGSISTRQSPGYVWLSQNAGAYGFKNLPSEPWHWSTTGR
jgi:hypothetical protein